MGADVAGDEEVGVDVVAEPVAEFLEMQVQVAEPVLAPDCKAVDAVDVAPADAEVAEVAVDAEVAAPADVEALAVAVAAILTVLLASLQPR